MACILVSMKAIARPSSRAFALARYGSIMARSSLAKAMKIAQIKAAYDGDGLGIISALYR